MLEGRFALFCSWSHVKISIISLISSLSLKLYLNSLVYHRHIFRSSSKVFGNLRKSSECFGISENVRGTFAWPSEQFWKNLQKSSEIGQKSLGNHHICRHWYVYIIKRTLHVSSKIYVLFAGREVCIGKNCARGLEYGLGPQAEGRTQDRGHSFSQYGPT